MARTQHHSNLAGRELETFGHPFRGSALRGFLTKSPPTINVLAFWHQTGVLDGRSREREGSVVGPRTPRVAQGSVTQATPTACPVRGVGHAGLEARDSGWLELRPVVVWRRECDWLLLNDEAAVADQGDIREHPVPHPSFTIPFGDAENVAPSSNFLIRKVVCCLASRFSGGRVGGEAARASSLSSISTGIGSARRCFHTVEQAHWCACLRRTR